MRMRSIVRAAARVVLFGVWLPVAAWAVPADQNFEAVPSGNTTSSLTVDGVVYTADGPAQVDVVSAVDVLNETYTSFAGKVVLSDSQQSADPAISYFEFRTANLADDFKLVSLAVNAQDEASGFARVYTITGYQGGASGTVVAEVTDVDFGTSGTYGTGAMAIDYTNEALASNGGTLAFGSAWDHIDTVRFTATGGSAGLALDSLNFDPPTVSLPVVTSATFDWGKGELTINGTGFSGVAGAANDVVASLLRITGEGGSYTLADTPDVDISSATRIIMTLGATDQLHVRGLLNRNGAVSSGGALYNLEAAEDWLPGAPAAANIADLTGNPIEVSKVGTPSVVAATYDSSSGTVVVTGANLFKKVGVNNDVDVSRFTFTGGTGNSVYTLVNTADVEITSSTSFTFTLKGADKINVDGLLDQLGTRSRAGTAYNIAAANGWLTGADPTDNIADLTKNPITVAIDPQITAALYSPELGVLVVLGSNFWSRVGEGNDIAATKFTITGAGGRTVALTLTADVDIDSITQFTLALSTFDRARINEVLDNVGETAADGTVYNLAAAAGWNPAAGDNNAADSTENGITVLNAPPVITNLDGDTVNFVVGGNAVTLDAGNNALVTDTTSPDFNEGSLTVNIVTNGRAAEDVLRIGTVGPISVSGSDVMHSGAGAIGTVTGGANGTELNVHFNRAATPSRVQDLVRALQYQDINAATLNTAARTVRVLINDGDGGPSKAQNITVRLARAPTIDLDKDDSSGASGGDYRGKFTEGAGAVAVADTDTVIVDDGLIKKLTVTLTNPGNGSAESLRSTYGTGAVRVDGERMTFSAYNSTTGVLTVTITDRGTTMAIMQKVITSLRYNNTSTLPDLTPRLITFVATDNGNNAGPPASAVLAMNEVNDRPTGAVRIDGTPTEYLTLTADTSTLKDPNGLGTFSYQWRRDDVDIPGAQTISYTLSRADVGAELRVVVSYVDGGGVRESVVSAPTAVVQGDLDHDGLADNKDPDIDGDGMPNTYEDANGLDKFNASDRNTDRDADGVNNYDEFIAGTKANVDDYAPVITAQAAITVNATGLFTAVDLGTIAASDGHDGEVQPEMSLVDARPVVDVPTHFRPGVHRVVWAADDAAGNRATFEQTVNVVPRVEFGLNQVSAEGATATFKVLLNGPPVTYPVVVPYTVGGLASTDGSDHDLVSGSVVINEPNLEGTVAFNIVDDGPGEGAETVVIRMGTPVNAVAGRATTHTVTIEEINVAPLVSLNAQQGGKPTRWLTAAGGRVTVRATVADANHTDTHAFDWANSDNALVDLDADDAVFAFDPSGLASGVYAVRVNVSDGDAEGVATLLLHVVDTLPPLAANDADGDGVTDQVEGAGDDDGDGVSNYLDHAGLLGSVLQEVSATDTGFLVESEPGAVVRLGRVAFAALRQGVGVSIEEVTEHANGGAGAEPDDENLSYLTGMFDFTIEQLPIPGQSVMVVLPQLAALPRGAVYRKLTATGWQTFVEDDNNHVASAAGVLGVCPSPGDRAYTPGLSEGHACVQLTIEDGGPNDADGAVDGSIADPGGVATGEALSPPPPEVVEVGVTGSGGGALTPWWLALLASCTAARARRVRQAMARWTVGAITLLMASAAAAEDLPPYYLGLSYLIVKGDERSGDFEREFEARSLNIDVSQTDIDRSGYSARLGYQFSDRAAVELAYVDLGEVKTTVTGTQADINTYLDTATDVHPTTASGWSTNLVLRKRLHPVVDVVTTVGMFFWDAEYQLASATNSRTFADSGVGGNFNMAMEANVFPRFPLRAAWNFYAFSGLAVSVYELGVAFRF